MSVRERIYSPQKDNKPARNGAPTLLIMLHIVTLIDYSTDFELVHKSQNKSIWTNRVYANACAHKQLDHLINPIGCGQAIATQCLPK